MVTFPHICVKMPFLEISKTSLPSFYGLYYWLLHEYRTRTLRSTKVSQKLALLGSVTTCRHVPKFWWKLHNFRWDGQPEDIVGESSSTAFWDQGDNVQLFHTGRTSEFDFNVFRSGVQGNGTEYFTVTHRTFSLILLWPSFPSGLGLWLLSVPACRARLGGKHVAAAVVRKRTTQPSHRDKATYF